NKEIRPYLVQAADVNKDGNTDLLFNHTNMDGESTDTLYYMLGKGNAQFDAPVALKMPDKVVFIVLTDVNADQWVDLVVSCANKTINVSLNHKAITEFEEKPVQVYPNPATSVLYIKAPFKSVHTLRLYTTAGQMVKEQRSTSLTSLVYTHGLLPGIYYLQIKGKEVNHQQAIWLR
ncbi:MAG TPA: T9SS type A sorting domain-containing protein, partial [Flavisolibacter sp.]|nr:T9SS type A sorting domain-containing protein [Flavisolibacter sp.]